MKHFFLLVSAGTLLTSPSVAQSGPVAQQSSEELVCQLTGDCGGAAPAATQDKGATRGFSLVKPGVSSRPSSVVQSPPAASRTPRTTYTSTKKQQPSTGLGYKPSYPIGRTDLAVTFMSGSATLTEQGRLQADQFLKALSTPKLAVARFAIEGHTDAVGGRAYNLDLSQRRAQALVDYLASSGVSRTRFDVRGYGFDKPINPRNPKSAANRRVEVIKVN